MTQVLYDPTDWLVSTTRAIQSYVASAFDGDICVVQMSFPDPVELGKTFPLGKTLIHFERDEVSSPVWAFGVQGVDEWSDDSHLTGTFRVLEAHRRIINFDIGVWADAGAGGETARMRAVQKLHDLFGANGARNDFNFAVGGGIVVRSFLGGRDALDRINDLPVWRTLDMTLIVEVFSKSAPPPDVVPEGFDITDTLTITP